MIKFDLCDAAEVRKDLEKLIEFKDRWFELITGWRVINDHNNIVHYWDSFPYCFLKQAVEFIEPEKPAVWKTLEKLIDFRMAIRQTEVNHCGYVEELLEGEKMTLKLYSKFMRLARAHDLQHHGSHTF